MATTLGIVAIVLLSGLFWIWSMLRPLPPRVELGTNSWFCHSGTVDCNAGTALARIGTREDRAEVTLDEVPEVVVWAVLSAEDRDFYDHGGLHPRSILRAALVDLSTSALSQGGSTITQQLVKNQYLDAERSWFRKLDEASIAIRLEREMSKDDILADYLNLVYLGRGATGVAAGAEAWFGRPLGELGLAEAALLAGLIRGPNSADPEDDPDETLRRRATVLDAMVAEGYVTRSEADIAAAAPVTPPHIAPRVAAAPVRSLGAGIGVEHAADWARRDLVAAVGAKAVAAGGYAVESTIDLDVQAVLHTAAQRRVGDGAPEVAMVALDRSGRVLGMVGGTDYEQSQLNVALGRVGGGTGRQAGSVFKPIVLAEALRQGIALDTEYDSPGVLEVAGASTEWEVTNYGGAAHGSLDLASALEVSSNTVFAQLSTDVGSLDVAQMARELGVTAELKGVDAIALGAEEVSLLDMATVFATFANDGVRIDPRVIERVRTPGGEEILAGASDQTRVLETGQAEAIELALRRVVTRGTGTSAGVDGIWVAGKTGTSQDHRDAWFVGSTCEITLAVWMGHLDGRPMDDVPGVGQVTGGSLPAEIFAEVVSALPRPPPCDLPDAERTSEPAVHDAEDPSTGSAEPDAASSLVPETDADDGSGDPDSSGAGSDEASGLDGEPFGFG